MDIPDIAWTLYNWGTASPEQLAKAKSYLVGRTDVLFHLKFYGDVENGTEHIECTVLKETGIKGNLDILGVIFIDKHGHQFVEASKMNSHY